MYGIPANIDLDGMIGQSVTGILVGSYCSNILFDDADIGSLAGGCDVLCGQSTSSYDGSPDTAAVLLVLLDHVVKRVLVKADDSIRIDFDNELSIVLRDESEQYESFTINVHGKLVLIV